ncbi:hypothetical protein [Flaviaesturariibacter amylovorans]|uniref:Uncharacterized protein n=1 Tax=Flaviaesturariibacter amylovorans TaxID=1084520 RepID=A0ABP8G3R7_9BACT
MSTQQSSEVEIRPLPKKQNGDSRWTQRVLLYIVLLAATVGLFFYVYRYTQEKNTISIQRIDAEKARLKLINDRLSSLYTTVYSSYQSSEKAKKDIQLEIDFLEKQRDLATKKIEDLSKDPDASLILFATLALVMTGIIFFYALKLFRKPEELYSPDDFAVDRNEIKVKYREFWTWLTKNEIAEKNLDGIDLQKARALKDIFDISEPLGTRQAELLSKIVEYSNKSLEEKQAKSDEFRVIYDHFKTLRDRLLSEMVRLNQRANFTLISGYLIASIVIGIIFYSAFNAEAFSEAKNWLEFSFKMIPKVISVVSLLTMFFFFIRTYKGTVLDVKYYQNELTNVDLKFVALRAALQSGDELTKNKIISDLSLIERNTIFSKEFTSNELERLKLENELHKDQVQQVLELVTFFKKKDDQPVRQ